MFDFSVVLSVYNVELWIREAVDSVIGQTIGFTEHIQLVFVDDGSTDASGDICEEYRRRYPGNVVVVHKSNEGPARARLTGLKHASGRYITFFDPDDIVTDNVFSLALDFYRAHGDEVDIAAIPIECFGDITGPHPLNGKFALGTRVIDLEKEWRPVQMSMASAFIRREALSSIDADPDLPTAEDAKEILRILVNKPKLGVITGCAYRYRKRSSSLVAQSRQKPQWYLTYIEHFPEWALSYCRERLGRIPKFVQSLLLYDLQPRYMMLDAPPGVLSEKDNEEYRGRLWNLTAEFDPDVVMGQIYLGNADKLAILLSKCPGLKSFSPAEVRRSLRLSDDDETSRFLSGAVSELVTVFELRPHDSKIEVRFLRKMFVPAESGLRPELSVFLDGTRCEVADDGIFSSRKLGPGLQIVEAYASVTLPFDRKKKGTVRFVSGYQGEECSECRVEYTIYAPLTHKVPGSYYHCCGVDFLPTGSGFEWKPSNFLTALCREIRMDWSIAFRGKPYERRAVIPRLAYFALYPFLHGRHYWLLTDKAANANDNGAALFLFMMEKKKKEGIPCRPVFALSRSSADWERMKAAGPVIPYMSIRHMMLHFFADHTVSAYSHNEISSPFKEGNYLYSNLTQHNKVVFLQHGIIKDDLSRPLNYPHKNYALFVTSSSREYDSVVNTPAYGYRRESIILTGFPRYDRLTDKGCKVISVMPTWRRSLCGNMDVKTGRYEKLPGFKNTEFCRFFSGLLTSRRLIDSAAANGYTIQFIPHPVLAPFKEDIEVDRSIRVLCGDVDYSRVFSESALVLTDYSSVFFDMAYLRKPVVYSHFESRVNYADGYFDYERDGFGEVEHTLDGTVDRLVEYMENGCVLKDKYRKRIDSFFCFSDRNCCRRVYEAICRLDDGGTH